LISPPCRMWLAIQRPYPLSSSITSRRFPVISFFSAKSVASFSANAVSLEGRPRVRALGARDPRAFFPADPASRRSIVSSRRSAWRGRHGRGCCPALGDFGRDGFRCDHLGRCDVRHAGLGFDRRGRGRWAREALRRTLFAALAIAQHQFPPSVSADWLVRPPPLRHYAPL